MRILIVDDEPQARARLAAMLEELDVEVVGEAANGVEALALAQTTGPDVVLLDIAMPEVDGLEVAMALPEPRPLVIFQTAHDEYALQAFEREALDYVLKPVTMERLEAALARARRRLEERHVAPAVSPQFVAELQAALAGGTAPRRPRVMVKDGEGKMLVPLKDVVKFASDEGGVQAVTRLGSYLTEYTLAELETRLGTSFLRVNRAELLNADHVGRIASNGDGSATITMADGALVHVSRRRAAEIRRILEG
jgi:DNA-binding LytR/AlgR family response regulator